MILLTPEKKLLILAGNFNNEVRIISVKINGKYLNIRMGTHSLQPLVSK
ncbi:MAG: hypothetical protein PHH37_15860 [Paludibacter sp.]|nr:hypothetical protein [Paludibacter sp.]